VSPRRRVLPALVVAMLAMAACNGAAPTPAERRTVEEWLLCEECSDGELDSVLALGDRAVPLLKDALEGPPDDRRANMRQQSEAMWRGLQDTTAVLLPTFVARYDSNYVASYQTRAAVALDSLDTPETRQILLDALRNDSVYRRDVRRVLGRSLGAQLSMVAGDSQHAPLDSFVRVNPEVIVRDAGTNAGLASVRVLFSVDSGNGTVFDAEELTDSAGRAEVRWQLGTQPKDSVNILRAVAVGRAVRFHARGHGPELRVVFVVQPRHGKVGQPLVPPVRIEVHDAWGDTQTQINQNLVLSLVGTGISSVHNVVAGVAHLPGLSIPVPGTGFRLLARVMKVEPAVSDSFDILP
jgi:hypothetical protein